MQRHRGVKGNLVLCQALPRNILAATPRNIGAPERAARQCMPRDLYAQM